MIQRLAMTLQRATLSLFLMVTAWCACFCGTPVLSDSTAVISPDTTVVDNRSWVRQLWDNGFCLNDPAVRYPRFARFCLKVYNWGDRTFNSYDSDYVVGTGKNWKLLAQEQVWTENYSFFFPERTRVHMISEAHNDLGASLHFMAVSVGYTFNTNDMFNRRGSYRSRFNVGFTCALFTGQYTTTKTLGGARILKFGRYNETYNHGMRFENVAQTSTEASVFYFFNHQKFSWAAATCFSKYQLRSAGSWIVGAQYIKQDISIDFSSLPQDMLEQLPPNIPLSYAYKNVDWCVAGGYSYSWVLKPRRWMINATIIPSLGYKHYRSLGPDGRDNFISFNGMIQTGVVYNHRALFAALTLKAQGYFYFTNDYTFLNSRASANVTVGMRF